MTNTHGQGIDGWPRDQIDALCRAEPKSAVPPLSLDREWANLRFMRHELQAGRFADDRPPIDEPRR